MPTPLPPSSASSSALAAHRAEDSLVARDLDVFWHPCSQMRDYRDFPPLEIVGAEGVFLELAGGRRIIDAISSWWCKALGHGHPVLRQALVRQAHTFEHVIAANTTHAGLVRLCERLLAVGNGHDADAWGPDALPGRRPGHFGKVFLADNGSTAVEIALKMALQAQAQRGHPARTAFAALSGGYHGETLGALSVGDEPLYKSAYAPLLFPVTPLGPLPLRSGPADPAWHDAGAEWPAIEAQLAPLGSRLAAIVYEPVLQAAGGMRLYSPDLLRRLRAWAHAHDVFLIADEIAAGMGRLGTMLAGQLAAAPGKSPGKSPNVAALAPLQPDFACLSKGLTGGVLPLSAVLTTDAVYDCFDADYLARRAFLHSNTYTGNALGVAVANAALDVFAGEDILGRVATHGPRLQAGLAALAAEWPYFKRARGCGMMAAVDLCAPDGSPLPAERRTGYRVFQEAVERGALLRPLGDTLYLFPPLTIAPAEIERLLAIVAESAAAVLGNATSATPRRQRHVGSEDNAAIR